MARKFRAKPEALTVRWGYETRRKVSKIWNDGRIGARLGTVTPNQLAGGNGDIKHLCQAHWDILKPSSFLTNPRTKTTSKTIKVRNVYLIPEPVVQKYLSGKKPRNKEMAIKKAISVLSDSGQAVCFHAVNALIGLDGKKATRQYIHSILDAEGYQKAYSVKKAPFWTPKLVEA